MEFLQEFRIEPKSIEIQWSKGQELERSQRLKGLNGREDRVPQEQENGKKLMQAWVRHAQKVCVMRLIMRVSNGSGLL